MPARHHSHRLPGLSGDPSHHGPDPKPNLRIQPLRTTLSKPPPPRRRFLVGGVCSIAPAAEQEGDEGLPRRAPPAAHARVRASSRPPVGTGPGTRAAFPQASRASPGKRPHHQPRRVRSATLNVASWAPAAAHSARGDPNSGPDGKTPRLSCVPGAVATNREHPGFAVSSYQGHPRHKPL